ncbi:MAG: DUF5995 family protein [Candidatus Saccharimonadales bacterium]
MAKKREKYDHVINIKLINSPKNVMAELDKLNRLLTQTELLQISFFNRAYLIVTKIINDANNEGKFTHSKTMRDLEVAFAKEYFEALNQYVKTSSLPEPWNKVKEGWLHNKHYASFSLLLGASAHIRHDLIRPLREVIHNPKDFQEDYLKVNSLLMESAKPISKSYYESKEHINFLKNRLRAIYLKPVMWLIISWRVKVWKEFTSIKI